jgi:hypothetical protein
MKKTLLFLLTVVTMSQAQSVIANDAPLSLSNLERERAALIKDLLNPDLAFESRLQTIERRQRQLTDMERMVIRDERLLNNDSRHVARAFEEYDLTFLVHAGAESNKNAAAQWLHEVKFSSQDVLKARAGYR